MSETGTRNAFPIEKARGLSHGTLECHEIKPTRRFFREFLGLDTVRHGIPAFMTWRLQPRVYVACVAAGEAVIPQGFENRWELIVANADEVRKAHEASLGMRSQYGIREVRPLETREGVTAFALQDLDGNWWEICDRDPAWYDEVFERSAGGA